MYAIQTLSQLPETREQQKEFANQVIEELMNGNHDLLRVWQQMTIIADTFELIKKSETLKQAVIAEVEKYGKDGATINGCKLTVQQRRNFDFSACNHAGYNASKHNIEIETKKLKKFEAFLKTLKEEIGDQNTGELIMPPTFTVTEYVVVK